MLFLIPLGIFVVVMVVFAFWPRRPPHMVDRDELDHPDRPGSGDPS
ncbi:hypothetical protein [Nocardioides sp. URHA0020]|nr:hypothetical protein [Nocardioides sp. URHA0020]